MHSSRGGCCCWIRFALNLGTAVGVCVCESESEHVWGKCGKVIEVGMVWSTGPALRNEKKSCFSVSLSVALSLLPSSDVRAGVSCQPLMRKRRA